MTNLTKADGDNPLDGVTHFDMGLAWDTSTGGMGGVLGWASRKAGSDLDAIGVLMEGNKPVAYVGLDDLDPCKNTSITHSGDEARGVADGDDETISFRFADIPKETSSVLLVAAAFKPGSSMKRAKNITVTLYDRTGGQKAEVAKIKPSLLSTKNVMAIAKIKRIGAHWALTVIDGEYNIKQGNMQQLLTGAVGM